MLDERPRIQHHHFMTPFRALPPKRERWSSGVAIPRHGHRHGYATIVLAGEYEEAGDYGRRRAVAGDVLFHGAFDAHANRMRERTTELFTIALPNWSIQTIPHASIPDPDSVVREAERDPAEALRMVEAAMCPRSPIVEDWADLLADSIRSGSAESFRRWADEHHLHPASLARHFGLIYGASPSRYRVELRSRRAWRNIVGGGCPLGTIAQDSGFSDQAHMSRCIKSLTGRSPGEWRGLKRFKTRQH